MKAAHAAKASLASPFRPERRWHSAGSRRLGVQAKLRIGRRGDRYEEEADRVADAVLRRTTLPGNDMKRDKEEETLRTKALPGRQPAVSSELAARIAGRQAAGRPMLEDSRASLEPHFGIDLSQVRLHTDDASAKAARDLGARAFTLGRDIAFAPGEYQPNTSAGRWLLAHELTHVAQQTGTGPSTAPREIRRQSVAGAPPAQPELRTALEGSDDEVRALTLSPDWGSLQITAPQAVQLLGNLLTGVALDEDEQAGLRILNKARALHIFDDTLEALHQAGRFGELLDDYHGEEYRRLLTLLSANIDRSSVKAAYLDIFIDMAWVREHEERAIVELLERTTLVDQLALLTAKNRLHELRKAIDEESLSRRYEEIVSKVNVQHGKALSTKLEKVFRSAGEKAVKAGKRTREEVDRLLLAAARDLASELQEYKARLDSALADPKKKSSQIAAINRAFERRLAGLIDQKTAEFGFELKYNKEFNRSLEENRKVWTRADLKKIDAILSKLPPEIVQAPARLGIFAREKRHEDYGGQARYGTTREMALPGSLQARIVSHELGHFVHDDAPRLYVAFQSISGWEHLARHDFTRHIPNAKARTNLLKKLDHDYCSKDENDREKFGGHYYRFDRYIKDPPATGCATAPGYYRYLTSARFISDYAKTDPADDFADSFEEYIHAPAELKGTCPKKYKFMHVRIFVEYWLRKQVIRLKKKFNKETQKMPRPASSRELRKTIVDVYVTPLQNNLSHDYDVLSTGTVSLAELGTLATPIPLKGWTGAKKLVKRYINLARDLTAMGKKILEHHTNFRANLLFEESFTSLGLESTFDMLSIKLRKDYREKLIALLDPLAREILKGKRIQKDPWPELQSLTATYNKATGTLQTHLPIYKKLRWKKGEFPSMAYSFLRRFPSGSAKREKLRKYILRRRKLFYHQVDDIEAKIYKSILAGTPWNAGAVTDPDDLLKGYKRDLQRFIAKMR